MKIHNNPIQPNSDRLGKQPQAKGQTADVAGAGKADQVSGPTSFQSQYKEIQLKLAASQNQMTFWQMAGQNQTSGLGAMLLQMQEDKVISAQQASEMQNLVTNGESAGNLASVANEQLTLETARLRSLQVQSENLVAAFVGKSPASEAAINNLNEIIGQMGRQNVEPQSVQRLLDI